jgi:ATP-dependent DNA ligase
LFKKIKPLETKECPFAKLPADESWTVRSGAARGQDRRWLKPAFVGQLEFVEWTSANHLGQNRFIGLRDDRKPKDVRREG